MGHSMMTTHMFRHPASGAMYIDILMCTLSVVAMGLDPTVDDCLSLALEEVPNES